MGHRVLVPVEWDDAMLRAFYDKRCPPDDTPAGGLTRWASWDDIKDSEGPRIAACWKAALSAAPSSGGVRYSASAMAHVLREKLNRGEAIDMEAIDRTEALLTTRVEATEDDRAWAADLAAQIPALPSSGDAHQGKALSVEEVARIIVDSTGVGTLGMTHEASMNSARDIAQAILAAMGRAE